MPVAFLLALFVIRVAFVQSYASSDPSRTSDIWRGHPAVIFENGLREIGAAAAAARPIDPALVHNLVSASAKAPLAPEPFLVRGVDAQTAGDQQRALRAFLAARQRSPRTVAARYFLADHYLKSGRIGSGLGEVSVLARLVPQSLSSIASFLAEYARSPGAAPQVKEVIRTHPQLEPILLDTLAADAANADLILSLWSGRGGEAARPWQGRLLARLVEAGRYEQARDIWLRFTGVAAASDRLFDPEFDKQALPPFGWSLASGSAGVVEPQGNGRLHVLFYGRDNLVLASQLLTLKPGRYRLAVTSKHAAQSSKSLEWKITCLPDPIEVAHLPLDLAGAISTAFSVPARGCSAQRLELTGTASEFSEQADVTISQLSLVPEAGR